MKRRILVCGGRTFAGDVAPVLDQYEFSVCITGGALGADSLAYNYAVKRGIPTEVYPAQWDRYGRAAGHLRNSEMLLKGRPDLIIAFPGGGGTKNMCKQAAKVGVKVCRVTTPTG